MKLTLNHFKTKGLFMINAALLLAVVSGYFIWTNPSVSAKSVSSSPQDTTAGKDEQYYKDLIYTVNEMNNQIEDYELQLQKHGQISQDTVQQGLHRVQQLIKPLEHPPESFQVSYQIASDMFKDYGEYMTNLEKADTAFITGAKRSPLTAKIRKDYRLFRENYNLVQIFSHFNLNPDCH